MTVEGYHFLPLDRRLQNGDGRAVTVGAVLSVPDLYRPLELGRYGLHGLARMLDALKWAPGPMLCRVRLSGQIVLGIQQTCAQHREVL